MKYYYIYHIPHFKQKNGKIGKIGCTDRLEDRLDEQGYTVSDCEILEIHTDIYLASDREKQLQREYGYRVDRKPYWRMVEDVSKGDKTAGGKITGKITGKRNGQKGSQPVLAFRKDTGELVGEFPSQIEAARQLGVNQGSINNVLSGERKQTGGYTFVRTAKNNSK